MALASDIAKDSKRNGRATSNLGHVRWEGRLLVGFLLSQPRVLSVDEEASTCKFV